MHNTTDAGPTGPGFEVSEVTVPSFLDEGDPHSSDFAAMVAIENANEAEALGTSDYEWTPSELLPDWHDPHFPRRLLLATIGGRVVGYGVFSHSTEDGASESFVNVGVDPAFRRRGIATALWVTLRQIAEESGCVVAQSFVATGPGVSPGGTPVTPGTGFGTIDGNSSGARFALAQGFSLEQVERISRLALPVPEATLRSFLADALTHAEGYRAVAWQGETPPQWRGDLARLRSMIHTEYPSGGLDIGADTWDEARVIEQDERLAGSGRVVLGAGAEHVASGRLVGFTTLTVPKESSRPVDQEDTLVDPAHRGHRLGMLLKVANLARLQESHPGHPSVITYNAEENRPMLRVNEALGFLAIGYEAAWKLTL